MSKKQGAAEKRPGLRLEWIPAGQLAENPDNWRRHPDKQKSALTELIRDPEIGWAGAALYNERSKRLIDGHLRRSVADPDELVPVLVGNWSPAAEKRILASLDPIGALATVDGPALKKLLSEVPSGGAFVDAMLGDLAKQADEVIAAGAVGREELVEIKRLETHPPPPTTWVLIGIPTVRFAEIAQHVDTISAVQGVVCEVCANNDRIDGQGSDQNG